MPRVMASRTLSYGQQDPAVFDHIDDIQSHRIIELGHGLQQQRMQLKTTHTSPANSKCEKMMVGACVLNIIFSHVWRRLKCALGLRQPAGADRPRNSERMSLPRPLWNPIFSYLEPKKRSVYKVCIFGTNNFADFT